MQNKLSADAFGVEMGCKLLREWPNKTKEPQGHWSESPTKPENDYDTTQQEFLATVRPVPLLRPFLEGWRFAIRINRDLIRCILKPTDASRWLFSSRNLLIKLDFRYFSRVRIKPRDSSPLSVFWQTESRWTHLLQSIPYFSSASYLFMKLMGHCGYWKTF